MGMRARATIFAAVMAVLAAGCAPSGGSQDGAEAGTITVWSWQEDYTAQWEEIFDVFEESHPGIEVEFRGISATEYDTVLRTAMSGDKGPDVMFLRSYGLFQYLVEGDKLVALDDRVADMSNWPDAILDGARGASDGKLYGVPFALQTLQVFQNEQLFDKYDVAPPRTWDQLLGACDTFRRHGITPIAGSVKDDWVLPIHLTTFGATRYGGPEFEQQLLSGQTTFTDPDYVAAIGLLREVVQRCFPADAAGVSAGDALTMFLSGKAAMRSHGSWEISVFQEQGQDLEVGLLPVPAAPQAVADQQLTGGYVDGSLGLNADSPHKKQAQELLRWLTTEEFGNLFMDKLAQPSVVPGTHTDNALLQQAVDNYRQHPTPYIEYADFGYGTPDGWTLARAQLQKVMLGQASPPEAAAAIQRGIGQWFEPQP